MKKYDVTIVGAGPAGSTAADDLARSGARVALVDKATFPRDKVCGDGITGATLARLEQMGLSSWLARNDFNAPQELLLSAPNGQSVRLASPDANSCYGQIVPRLELDTAILEQATQAGAELHQGVQPRHFSRLSPFTVRITSGKSGPSGLSIESHLLITADGAHASFTRHLGLVRARPDLVAIRAYFEEVPSETLVEIHYQRAIIPGYAWIFPLKGGRANVGLGAHTAHVQRQHLNLKDMMNRFIQNNPYAKERLGQAKMVSSLQGYPLRAQMSSVTPVADNILVAGEAAGLVNPLTGEGIGTALLSGRLAARQAIAALEAGRFSATYLGAYAQALKKQIGRTHFMAAILRKLLTWPGMMNRAVQRARHDAQFRLLLSAVVVEAEPPSALLRPGAIARWLAG